MDLFAATIPQFKRILQNVERWLDKAGAVESYREQWRVEPDQLGLEGNVRGAQAIAWEDLQLRLAAVEPPTTWR